MGAIQLCKGNNPSKRVPKKLHHYTGIDTLALILKHRTIRFAPLASLDDPLEEQVIGPMNPAKCEYVSCWTDLNVEQIPMWREYASAQSGVRITLPTDPFKTYPDFNEDLNATEYNELFSIGHPDESGNRMRKPAATLIEENLFSYDLYASRGILHEVHYTDDMEEVVPRIMSGTGKSLTTSLLGTVKHTCWNYQSEWRYILTLYPFDPRKLSKREKHETKRLVSFLTSSESEARLPPFYDLIISEEAFSEMEVTLSPLITAGNQEIVHTLLEKYNPNATISLSKIALRQQ